MGKKFHGILNIVKLFRKKDANLMLLTENWIKNYDLPAAV